VRLAGWASKNKNVLKKIADAHVLYGSA